MIIELFGPPGSGKTTFSHQLAEHLRARGIAVELALSQRPAEPSATRAPGLPHHRHARPWPPIARRLTRPLIQLLVAASTSAIRGGGWRLVSDLLRLFPQRPVLRALRLRQYLLRLHDVWLRAAHGDRVVIFDQGFVQAIYSLAAASSPTVDPAPLGAAMDCVPLGDILIEMRAPLPVLRVRLARRLSGQSRVERLLEQDARPAPHDGALLDAFRAQLALRNRTPLVATSESPNALPAAMVAIRSALQAAEVAPAGNPPSPRPGGCSKPGRGASSTLWFSVAASAALLLLGAAAPGHLAALWGRGIPAVHHYASQTNFDADGRFAPGSAGFDLADVSSAAQLAALPEGVRALVWVGLCTGADAAFRQRVEPFLNRPEVFGFYLMDDPDPRGLWHAACPPDRLRSEADWIRSHDPRVKTFVALMNMGPSAAPDFQGSYDPDNTHVDLFGIAAYPCRTTRPSCDPDWVDRSVAAAERAGIDRSRIVPVFQTFGGGNWRDDEGGRYVLPSPDQAEAMLARWDRLVPAPAFDFAYSWASDRGAQTLASSPALQSVFRRHNLGASVEKPALSKAASEAAIP